jgi:peroxiredoxin (alkyl hydroperoxide reductase subunit C)
MENNVNGFYQMPLVGDKAPSFNALTTDGEINFPEDYKGNWVVFFSHPGDFTPVCTTEFITFASMKNDFDRLNTKLLGLSVGSIHSHIAWMLDIKDMNYKGMGNVEINFPIVEDITMDIAKKYGMIQPGQSSTKTVRAVFIIDPNGIIRTILYYPLTTGRNINEILRIIMALQKSDREGVVTPANWMPGEDAIIPPAVTYNAAKQRLQYPDANTYCLDWFMCFKKENR